MKLVAGVPSGKLGGGSEACPPQENFEMKRSRNAISSIFRLQMEFTQDQGNRAAPVTRSALPGFKTHELTSLYTVQFYLPSPILEQYESSKSVWTAPKVWPDVEEQNNIKMISAERLSNECKNKVTKKLLKHSNIFNKTLAPKLTPQEKTEFEVIHIPIKKMLYVSSKQNGTHF